MACNRVVWQALTALLVGLPLLAFSSGSDTNQVPSDLTALPLESLMQIEVPVVYAASKIDQKITLAPASVTVITSDDVKKFGYQTLGDVLQSVQGFNVSYDRNYDFVGVRGINLGDANDRILLLVDGHRVNNNLTDGALVDTAFLLDMGLVDRVEVIRGPSAVLYGNNAFFGVINVITRTGAQLNGFEVSGDYGSFDAYKARVSYGRLFTNGVEMLLSGTYFNSAGNSTLFFPEYNTPAQNNGVAQNMDNQESGSFFGSLSYGDLSMEGAFIHREKVDPTAYFDTAFNDPRLKTTDEQGYGALKYAHSFEDDFDLTGRLYYDTYYHEIGYPYPSPTPFYLEQDTGEWWGTELQLNKRLWDRHTFTLGAEYRDDFKQQNETTDQPTVSRERQSYGVYLQSDIALLDNLHFDGGIRYDQYSDYSPAYDPRLALIYNPIESSTLKAIYGTAFRAPNFTELSNPGFQNIQPEEITSYELDYDQQYGGHLRSSVSGFYNQMHDLIVYDSGNYENIDANTRGVEVALESSWTNGLHCRASYSFQSSRDFSVTWPLPDSPNHMAKFDLSVPLYPDKLFAGVEWQYTSGSTSVTSFTNAFSNPAPYTEQGEDAGGFGVLNLTLFSQHVVKNLECSVSLYNVLGRRYSTPASLQHVEDIIQQDGRTFQVNLTYRF